MRTWVFRWYKHRKNRRAVFPDRHTRPLDGLPYFRRRLPEREPTATRRADRARSLLEGRKGLKKKCWLALLLLGSAEAAIAQTDTGSFGEATASTPSTIGAVPRAIGGIVRQIGVRAAVDLTYESNVFGVNAARAGLQAGRNRSLDDFTLSPSLQLDLQLPFGARQSAFLQGAVGYDFQLRNSQLNRERISLNGGANLNFGSCAGTVNGSISRFRTNAGDIFVLTPTGFDARRNVVQRTGYGAQVQCGGAIGLSPSIGYQHAEIRNSSDLLELNDSNQDSINASIGYQRPSLGRVSIFGSYSKTEFPGRDANFNRRTLAPISNDPNPFFDPRALDGVTSYSTGIRFERDIGSRIYGAISAGYTWVDPESNFSRRFRGSNYSANISLRPSDRFSLDLGASRSADVSTNLFASFAITEVYSLNGTYQLNPRISLNFGTSYQKRDFRGPARAPDLTAFLTNDEFIRAYGGVAFNLNRRLRLNGLVSQVRRKSDNGLFGFNNTTVSLRASLALGR